MKKKEKILVYSLVIVILFEMVFITYLLLDSPSEEEIINTEREEEVEDENKEEEGEEEEETGEADIETESEYKYSYIAESVVYESDTANYGGYRVCDDDLSTCTVYGVSYEYIARGVLGGEYRVSFNSYECQGAAAGTTYCIVIGEAEVLSLVKY